MKNNGDQKELWYKNGLRFQCQKCGNCCKGEPGYVWVSRKEIENISLSLGLRIEEFARKNLKKVGSKFSLIELSKGDCVMYKEAWGCKIYPVRPKQCSTFPFWPSNLESHEEWTNLKEFCKGIDKGPLYTFSAIQEIAFGCGTGDTPRS
ncbi:MAG TPA: YkgJ family cysteine cluster protein [Candidatus Hypogeohydataceae bacterium YC41]